MLELPKSNWSYCIEMTLRMTNAILFVIACLLAVIAMEIYDNGLVGKEIRSAIRQSATCGGDKSWPCLVRIVAP